MRLLLIAFIVSLLSSCNSVKYDFKPNIDFSNYKTFSFVQMTKSKSLNRQRLENALVEGLSKKGMKFIPDASAEKPADLVIKPRHQTVITTQMTSFQSGYYNRNYYAGSNFHFTENRQRYLIVELVDTKKNEVVWQGRSHGFNGISFSQEKFDKIIGKMMEFYPPDINLKK